MKKLIAILILSAGVAHAGTYVLPSARSTDWTLSGVQGDIPTTYTSGGTISGVVGDGVTDDTAAIQSAITGATSFTYLTLPVGTYRITADLKIGVGHGAAYDKHIIIRGADKTNTVILMDYNGGTGAFLLKGSVVTANQALSSGYTKDSTSVVTTASPSGLTVGDYVGITQTMDTTFWLGHTAAGHNYDYECNQITNIVGSTITLVTPLMRTYSASQSPRIERIGMAYGIGIENLTISLNSGKTANNAFYFWRTANSWVKDVRITNYYSDGLTVDVGYRNTFRSMDVLYTGAKITSSYGIQIGEHGTRNVIENCIGMGQPTFIMVQNGSYGNVLGYNFDVQGFPTDSSAFGIGMHGGAYMTLMEGNVSDEIRQDEVWGGNMYNVLFRNYLARIEPTLGPRAFDFNAYGVRVDATNYYSSSVANVIWEATYQTSLAQYYGYSPTAAYNGDPASLSTAIKHGNYIKLSNSVEYDAGEPDHAFSTSLYLSSKPTWFSTWTWPTIGPDVSGYFLTIPPVARYLGLTPQDPPPVNGGTAGIATFGTVTAHNITWLP